MLSGLLYPVNRSVMVKTWKLVGGRLCLDFINTVGGRVSSGRDYAAVVLRDKLARYEDLLDWAEYAGALTRSEARRLSRRAASDSQAAASVMQRTRELREALYRLFKSVAEKLAPHQADMKILAPQLSV